MGTRPDIPPSQTKRFALTLRLEPEQIGNVLGSECNLCGLVFGPSSRWSRGSMNVEGGGSGYTVRVCQECRENLEWVED